MDIIDDLKEMALASRLKRLSEHLLRDASQIYRDLGMDFEARWFPLLYALRHHSPQSITGLADMLRLTHPAVHKLAGEMEKKGLLISRRDKDDERRRLLGLSRDGRLLADKLAPVWEDIRQATGEILAEAGGGFLNSLRRAERAIDSKDLSSRVRRHIRRRTVEDLQIIDYAPAMKKHFKSLNRQWLEEYFELEEPDIKLLNDPRRLIINKGGAVLFARLDNRIVGTGALLKLPDGDFELAKMAVEKKYRRRGIGLKLAQALIDRARALNAGSIFLATSRQLEAAIGLYTELGFRQVTESSLKIEVIKRPSIIMQLILSDFEKTGGRK